MNLKQIQLLQEAYMSVYEETDAERDKRLADRRARVAELQVSGRTMTPARRAREKAQQRKSEQEQEKLDKILGSIRGGSSRRSDRPMGSTPPAEKEAAPEANRRLKSKTKSDTLASRADEILRGMRKEDVNVFDILISHLLDEGYAEDVKNAYCILENMSEEWVLEILDEELTGERKRRALEKAGGRGALGKIPMPLAARVAVGREGQPLEVARKDPRNSMRTTVKGPTKRGGSGFKGRSKSDFQGTDDTVGSGNKAARRAGKEVRDTSDEL